MVFAHKVLRITLSGTMWSGAEEWSTGFFLGEESADAVGMEQAGLDQIRDAWATFFSATGSQINSSYRFTQAKCAPIDGNGFTVQNEVLYSVPSGTVAGGVATNTLPGQCALVATLLSDRPRGKASKGRMYLPGYSGGMLSTGKINTTMTGTIADGLKTFFDSFAADADVPDELILAAKGTGVAPQLTAQNDYVQTIRVGDVVDTQRRRRNGLTESYTTRTLL